MFNDKAGEELVNFQAQKDLDSLVKNDETRHVGHDRTTTIDNDETVTVHGKRTETVDKDETITIHQNRTETVDQNETITIHQNRKERVDENETISIGGNRSETVYKDEQILIKGNRKKTVNGNDSLNVDKDRSEHVHKSRSLNVDKNNKEFVKLGKSVTVGLGYATQVGTIMNTAVGIMQAEEVGVTKKTMVGKSYSINVGEEFKITVGKASLVMKSDGSIIITGSTITSQSERENKVIGKDVLINPLGGQINQPAPSLASGSANSSQASQSTTPLVKTGLGKDIDLLASKSPTLVKEIIKAQTSPDSWAFVYGTAGGGSYTDRSTNTITLDSKYKTNIDYMVQVLAHEIGHANFKPKYDMSSRSAFILSALEVESVATVSNIIAREEIIANGGPDIGVAGVKAKEYIKIYNNYGTTEKTYEEISKIFGSTEQTSNTGDLYDDYYGNYYDSLGLP